MAVADERTDRQVANTEQYASAGQSGLTAISEEQFEV